MDRDITVFGQVRNSTTLEETPRSLRTREYQLTAAVLNNNVNHHALDHYRNSFEEYFHDTIHLVFFTANHGYGIARLNRAITRLRFLNEFLDNIENGHPWNPALLNQARVEAVNSIEVVHADDPANYCMAFLRLIEYRRVLEDEANFILEG